MRVRLIIKDTEYRNALADGIGKAGSNILVEIAGKKALENLSEKTLILTDCNPSELDHESLELISRRTLFLSSELNPTVNQGGTDNLTIIFKYSSLSSILAELHNLSFNIDNEESDIPTTPPNSSFAICCDGDSARATDFGLKLARQLTYRMGVKSVVIPLSFINYSGVNDESCKGTLARLFYSIEAKRSLSTSLWIAEDELGVGRIRIPNGINQLAYEEPGKSEDILRLLKNTDYKVTISIIGDCFTEGNIRIMRNSEKVFWLASYYSERTMQEYMGPEYKRRGYEYVDIKTIQDSIDVWIDNYVLNEYGNR